MGMSASTACMSVCQMCAGARGGQKSLSDPRELELQMLGSHHVVLGINLGLSGLMASILTHWAISPATSHQPLNFLSLLLVLSEVSSIGCYLLASQATFHTKNRSNSHIAFLLLAPYVSSYSKMFSWFHLSNDSANCHGGCM